MEHHTINLAGINRLDDGLRRLPIDLASDTVGGAKNLLDDTPEFLRERLEAHRASNLDDLVEAHGLSVLDVLLLLAITRRLLERLDDEGRSSRDDGDLGLTILDSELDSYAQAFLSARVSKREIVASIGPAYPVACSLGDVFADLLRRETKGANLGS